MSISPSALFALYPRFCFPILVSIHLRSQCVAMATASIAYYPWHLTNLAMSWPRHLFKGMKSRLRHRALLACFPLDPPMPFDPMVQTEQRVNIETGGLWDASCNQDTIASTRARARFAILLV